MSDIIEIRFKSNKSQDEVIRYIRDIASNLSDILKESMFSEEVKG